MTVEPAQFKSGQHPEGGDGLDVKDSMKSRPDFLHELPLAVHVHFGRLLAGAVVLATVVMLVWSLASNQNMQWDVIGEYLFGPQILLGLLRTLGLTILAMIAGILLGTVLALMRLSSNRVLSGSSTLFVGFFRGTPLLVQIIFWFNLSLLFPVISFGGNFSINANALITPFVASLLALGLNEAAYMSEIVRAGILSVEPGQYEAAQTIGLSRGATTRRVVLPQAMRVIIPPTGNQVIGMLKSTSLVSVIAYPELLYSAQLIYSRTYETIPLLIVVSIWYLVASTILSYLQGHLERRFSRGRRPAGRGSVSQPNRDRRPSAVAANVAQNTEPR